VPHSSQHYRDEWVQASTFAQATLTNAGQQPHQHSHPYPE
jgi:hypothetical protein